MSFIFVLMLLGLILHVNVKKWPQMEISEVLSYCKTPDMHCHFCWQFAHERGRKQFPDATLKYDVKHSQDGTLVMLYLQWCIAYIPSGVFSVLPPALEFRGPTHNTIFFLNLGIKTV